MATSQSTVDYILDQITSSAPIRSRKMFGEYAIYCNEKIVSLVCDEHLFVKITPISRQFLDESHEAAPYPGAKNYLKVPAEKWDDREWLSQFISETAAILPIPQQKRSKKNPNTFQS